MKLLIGFFMLVLVSGLRGEVLKDEKACRAVCEAFMADVQEVRYDEAFARVKPLWPIAEKRYHEVLEQTKAQLPKVAAAYGGKYEVEFVRTSRVGKSFLRLVYLQKFEKSAARWEFVFYRGSKGWSVNRVVWNDKTYELFVDDKG